MKKKLMTLALGLALTPVTAQQLVQAQGQDVSSRVEQRRTSLQVRMNATDKARVVERCVAAQAKVEAMNQKFTTDQQTLKVPYDNFTAKLQTVTDQNPENTQLKAAKAEYDTRLKALQDAVAAFTLSSSDLKHVNCKTEPNGFKATLETARTDAKTVQTSYESLRSFVKADVKIALQSVKAGTN